MGRFRIGCIAWALVFIGALGGQAMTAAPVHLTCHSAPGVPQSHVRTLCDALAGQLRQADPSRQILRDGTRPRAALELVLTVTEVIPQQITAYLAWHEGAARGETPPLSLSVVDTSLKPRMYDQLARALIAEAGIVN